MTILDNYLLTFWATLYMQRSVSNHCAGRCRENNYTLRRCTGNDVRR